MAPPSGLPPVETDRDPGLQPERTRLAWRRTTLTCAVTAVLAMRQAVRSQGTGPAVVAVGLAALTFLAFLLVAHRRIQRLGAARPAAMPPGTAVSVVLCMVALALFGTAVVWW